MLMMSLGRESTSPTSILRSAMAAGVDSHRLAVAVFAGQFDQSRTGRVPPAFTVCGFVASGPQWQEFETRWSRVLHSEEITAFSALDFSRRSGEFAVGWDETRCGRLLETLQALAEEQTLYAFSCSLSLKTYHAINDQYAFSEHVAGPHGTCLGVVAARAMKWMAIHHPKQTTVVAFAQNDIDERELTRVLQCEAVEREAPVRAWSRQAPDGQGRVGPVRPFEACDLLAADREEVFVTRLLGHSHLDRVQIGRDDMLRMCDVLRVPRRTEPIAR